MVKKDAKKVKSEVVEGTKTREEKKEEIKQQAPGIQVETGNVEIVKIRLLVAIMQELKKLNANKGN